MSWRTVVIEPEECPKFERYGKETGTQAAIKMSSSRRSYARQRRPSGWRNLPRKDGESRMVTKKVVLKIGGTHNGKTKRIFYQTYSLLFVKVRIASAPLSTHSLYFAIVETKIYLQPLFKGEASLNRVTLGSVKLLRQNFQPTQNFFSFVRKKQFGATRL
ncbi:hypothetical protein O181_000653 [Austropuccinia psidii MF-1]|uniref:Uncharacterized protein n=1 Tax=Austropuccinia psidii MF-1 TaxID=1389203 RepID=A0A9Q3B8X9_9BASI|nr:hypothetical protein [Austropuccinia psidii MF-1]